MDNISERACYINSMELCNTPETSQIDDDQNVSPVLSRSKKYYRKISADKSKYTSSPQTSPRDFTREIKQISASPVKECKFKTDILSKIYEGFKTATGKNLSVSEVKVRQQAQCVFGDILNVTPAPIDQNPLSKSDSAGKRSFLTRVNNMNASATSDGKSACGDRVVSTVNINTPERALSKEFSRNNRATEVYSNTNYNELSTEDSDTFCPAKNRSDINEITDSELVYLADTAEYLSKSRDINKAGDVKKAKKINTRHQTTKHDHNKSHINTNTKRTRLKQVLSKNVVDPIVSQSIMDIHNPALAKNIYELHRNIKFTDESEQRVCDKQNQSIIGNLMKMFGVNLKSTTPGFTQDELGISREVFDRHSKVLEAVVRTMQADEQLQQKKMLKRVRKLKNQKSSHRDKDSAKRKLEDINASPVQVKDKRSRIAIKKNAESISKVINKVQKSIDESENLNTPVNKKLQIEIGSTNVKININSLCLTEPHIGFRSASGRDINITPMALEAAQQMYKSAERDIDPKIIETILEEEEEQQKELILTPTAPNYCGFESIATESDSISTVRDDIKPPRDDKCVVLGFSSASGTKINVSAKSMRLAQGVYQRAIENHKQIKFDLINSPGNINASDKNKNVGVMLSVDKNQKSSEDVNLNDVLATANASKCIKSPVVKKKTNIPSEVSLKSAQELIGDAVSSMDTALIKLAYIKPRLKLTASKKRLGMTSAKCKPIAISKHSLVKAKSLFDDTEDTPNLSASLLRAISPNTKQLSPRQVYTLKSSAAGDKNTSPIREISPTRCAQLNDTINGRLRTSTPAKAQNKTTSFYNLSITPINIYKRGNNLSTIQESPSIVVLMDQSSSDLTQIKADLDVECEMLKKKLNVLNDRKSALDLQESIIITSTSDYKKPKPGILYLLKQRVNRVPLKDLQLCSGDNLPYFNVDATILDFTFTIADRLHFINTCADISVSTIKTKDGAIIVPSVNDSIGLTEISRGFHTMPSINPDLIPKGWIGNHFKMIVWKLASYERIFPHYFKNSLCLENVLQQLKYRYDREIDRVERSAIRRITEKDDVPQKRMVLCVADIHEVSKKTYELDLTDGWYLIRTQIDRALSHQVAAGKIRAGIKLMIQNAELINCADGAHPLQLPDCARLRINLNSTRRSPWHLKLGYQKQTGPLAIRLSTVHPDGGQIAFVRVYINRVYPMRYLELSGSVKVWRNAKGEEKRAEECARETCGRVEIIQERIMRDYSNRKLNTAKVTQKLELSGINCAEQLYNLLEGCNDPESFVENLTADQRTDLMAYMQTSNVKKQEEVLAKINEEMHAQKTIERNVTGVLRLLVTDFFDKSTDGVILTIWRPTEDILDSLTEDCVVSVFNINPNKLKNELSSTPRTYFKIDEKNCQKNNRQIVPIAMTVDSYYKPAFNEMDIVGLVVQSHVAKHRQELWLCDFQGRLLLVQIHDGPKYCCLLDNIARGDCVAVLNVLVHKAHKYYGWCVANQLSIVSTHPRIKLHRDSLDAFKRRLPNDVKQLLAECDIKIEKYRISGDVKGVDGGVLSSKMVVHTSFDNYVDEGAFNSSGLTAEDVALSMLQIDAE